jgi:hypothetical protein
MKIQHPIRSLAVLMLAVAAASAVETKLAVVKQPVAAPANRHYQGNREPLLASPLVKLPVGAIKPRGWLRGQMELMAGGFSGHLDELSEFLKPEGNAWLSPKGEGDASFWEELPYWLKGFGDLGYLLDDPRIIKEARRWIEAAIASQRDDGYFGPRRNVDRSPDVKAGNPDLWPNMVMLNALQSYYEYSGDERVIRLMTNYFRWQLSLPEEKFLLPFWQQQRASDNLASVYWLYNRTGEPWLLKLAEKTHRHTANWTGGIVSWHGVNISQSFRGPAVYFQQSKDPLHLAATERNYRTVRGMYGRVPGGLYGADENCRPGYTDPRQGTETCTMVEMMLSDEMLLGITGDTRWADRCENVAFNSLPASMTADLKALRYLTAPNMPLSDRADKSPGLQNGGAMLLYDPRSHRCCQHNVAHGWPYFTENLWMGTAASGLAAVMYAPCEVKAKVGDGTEVRITEKTDYPFDDTIELSISAPKDVQFPLMLRVPRWCERPQVLLDGKDLGVPAARGSYVLIDRLWSDGAKVTLKLPMRVTLTRWKENHDCVSVNRGPLTYSLKIGEKVVRVGGSDKWPAIEIRPTTPWNYGLVLDDADPAAAIQVRRKLFPLASQPFAWDSAPIELVAQAKKIPAWKLDPKGLVGKLVRSPVKSGEPTESVTLIPMGCARLRIASFPLIGSGPDAHDWPEPPPAKHVASHCNESDTVDALSNGLVPKNSNDHSIRRFTWWPCLGSEEWVTYRFEKPRKVSAVEVYWFDDTGSGQCRVPKAWRLEWLDGNEWRPVQTSAAYGVEKDKFNCAVFQPVTTKELRLVAQLRPGFSGGILEWRVK